MHSLEAARRMAKTRYANPSGTPVAIYNFNRFSPLYVVRDYCPEHSERSPNFVERVDPD